MSIGLSIAGRKVSPDTNNADFYQTPPEAVMALLSKETFDGLTWEPCAGNGAIAQVLEQHGIPVMASELREAGYGITGCNALEPNFWIRALPFRHAITNPPYHIAEEIISACIESVSGKVAMLLKLTFLESEKRREFFEKYPPARIHVFRRRITMYPEGTAKPRNNGTIAFAWFVWEKGFSGKPTLNWI
jgi:hypothetical protein